MGIINYLGNVWDAVSGRTPLYGFNSNGGIQHGVTGDGFFVPVNNVNNVLTLIDYKDFDNAFFGCSTLQTVVINKGQCKINAKWDIYKGDKVSNNPKANEVREKMKQPNVLQNYNEFRLDVSIYVAIHGFCVLWFVPNGARAGTGFQNIWALNPADLVITYKQSGKYVFQTKLEDIIESIKLNYAGGQIDVPLNEVSFVKDQTATKSTNGMHAPIVPTSRIYGLKMILSNNMAAYDARNSLTTNRGPQGFLSNSSKDAAGYIPLSEDDKIDLQRDFNKYGTLRGQRKMIIAKNEIKFVPIGIPTRELMLFEETEETMCRILDVFGYPVGLLALSKTNTIGNKDTSKNEDRRNLYQNTIIPEDMNELPAIFSKFGLEKEGLQVKSDYSHIEELKEDEAAKESLITARINNIRNINALQVEYEVKINIACEQFGISTEEAAKIISKNDTITEPGSGDKEAA